MAIGTTSAGPGISLTIPDDPPRHAPVPYGECAVRFTGHNSHGEADTSPPR